MLRVVLLLCLAAVPSIVAAQARSVYDTSVRSYASRPELNALADSLEKAIMQPGVSNGRRRAMQDDLDIQRQRLATGDMAPGDRILLRMSIDATRQDTSSARQDTLIVSTESTISIPGLPPIPMQGVLRSEVEGHLRSQISAVIRSARVSAVPLLSIGVLGAVTRPGYFWVPVTASVSDAIMVAGGPATDADLKSLVMLRAGKEQWSRATMTAALQRRISLGSLGADDGDVLSLSKAAAPLDRNFLMGALGLALQSVFLFSTLR